MDKPPPVSTKGRPPTDEREPTTRRPIGGWKAGHPVVSFRIPREELSRLAELVQSLGRSKSELLKIGLGLMHQEIIHGRAEYQRGYDEGFDQGHGEGYEYGKTEGAEEGSGKFEVLCFRCHESLMLDSLDPQVRKQIDRWFTNWYHAQGCPE